MYNYETFDSIADGPSSTTFLTRRDVLQLILFVALIIAAYFGWHSVTESIHA